MPAVNIRPSDTAIRRYYRRIAELRGQNVSHEGGLRSAFGALLRETARKQRNWTLVEEQPVGRVRPDGTLRDQWQLPHGYWEAKDGQDDLEVEIRRKRERGYPFSNILFEDTRQAVLYQNDRRVMAVRIADQPTELARLLGEFYSHEMPDFAAFRDAGRELAHLHLNYEQGSPWPLDWETAPGKALDLRVQKMRPAVRVPAPDGAHKIFDGLRYNETLTLRGIPAEAFRYRLGTRSALERVIDRYRAKTDKRSGIASDPNAWSADPQYIVDRVIALSVRTVAFVEDLAQLPLL